MGLSYRGYSFGRAVGAEYFNAITDSTAEALTVPDGARAALISVIGAEPIKWRVDGIDPTSAIGHPLSVGGHVEIFRDDLVTFRVVCGTAAQSTEIFVTYYEE